MIARLLKLDIDFFSVAARAADMVEEDYRQRNSPMPAIATCLYALLTHCIRMKVDALGPIAFEDPAPGSNG